VVHIPAGNQRVLLAALLLNQQCPMPPDEVADLLWAGDPPPSARVTVHNYVKRLRQRLQDADRLLITTQAEGYLLQIPAANLDIPAFEAMTTRGRNALRSGQYPQAADELRAALALWRGRPLANVTCAELIARHAPRLEELRAQALEERIEADLHCGRQDQAVSELRVLIAADPFRERLHCMLMLALYLQGRQADALAAYQAARHALLDEIGVEPGAELRRLHQRILDGAPALIEKLTLAHAERDEQPGGSGSPFPFVVPRQLPQRARGFTGRTRELKTLTELLGRPDGVSGTIVISVIAGTAGVGKSELAVHLARKVIGDFPDGQLFVNLRGYDPDGPMPAADALAGFLRALGVPGQDIPPGADERAALYRSLLAGRQVLIVADNAGSAEQVRPLLPGTPTCAVLVTSRDALAGLVARDGAARLDLDLLPPAEAAALLRTLIGPRVNAEPDAATELADQCCRLPLALRVAAELAATRPAASLAGLTGELADLRTRLDLLDAGGDPRTHVRTVFSWSYRHLDADAARAFRLLGLHPGPDIEPYAAAALTGAALPLARQALDVLARAHLIQPAAPGRYGMHDLLRGYARELSATVDGAQEQQAALTRLFDHYLQTTATAMDALFPAESGRRPRISPSANPAPPVTDPAAARAWLDAELANLAATVAHTAAQGWPGHAVRLAVTLFRYLDAGGHVPEAVSIHMHAHRAAAQTGDLAAEAEALTSLGVVDLRQGRYEQAARRFREALALRRELGDRAGEARALHNLGGADLHQGRYEQAARRFREALALRRELGDRAGEARALGNLGALELLRGHYRQAARYLESTLTVCRELGDRAGEAHALGFLGTLDLRHGRYQDAACHYRQALALCREFGVRSSEAAALNGLGEVLLATGQPGQASAQHVIALDLAGQTGDWFEQARAHSGLARVLDAVDDAGQALRHWQQALMLYTRLGSPEADQIRARLAGAAPPT
jgi:DNA-binding SARP family transcriptional activator/Flp pilus assembly protein TadD